jgi:hypothetical protein
MSLQSLKARVSRLERLLDEVETNLPGSVPHEWLNVDPVTGRIAGPPAGLTLSKSQQETWDLVVAMDATVPAHP